MPIPDEPELDLILAAQCGDRDAMHRLLAAWNDSLFGFLLNQLRHRADAEDATQECFIRVVKGLPNYQHQGQFRAWIFHIARNQASLTRQRRQRLLNRESEEFLDQIPNSDLNGDPASDLASADSAADLRAAIETLPEKEREVLRYRLNEDLKFREIAELTGDPLNTILGRMHNAARRLREITRLRFS